MDANNAVSEDGNGMQGRIAAKMRKMLKNGDLLQKATKLTKRKSKPTRADYRGRWAGRVGAVFWCPKCACLGGGFW
jgi:hypothetical protein